MVSVQHGSSVPPRHLDIDCSYTGEAFDLDSDGNIFLQIGSSKKICQQGSQANFVISIKCGGNAQDNFERTESIYGFPCDINEDSSNPECRVPMALSSAGGF